MCRTPLMLIAILMSSVPAQVLPATGSSSGTPVVTAQAIMEVLRSCQGTRKLVDVFGRSVDRPSGRNYFKVTVAQLASGKIECFIDLYGTTGRFRVPQMPVCTAEVWLRAMKPVIKKLLQKFGDRMTLISPNGFHIDDFEMTPRIIEQWNSAWAQERPPLPKLACTQEHPDVILVGNSSKEIADKLFGASISEFLQEDPVVNTVQVTFKDDCCSVFDATYGELLHRTPVLSLFGTDADVDLLHRRSKVGHGALFCAMVLGAIMWNIEPCAGVSEILAMCMILSLMVAGPSLFF